MKILKLIYYRCLCCNPESLC